MSVHSSPQRILVTHVHLVEDIETLGQQIVAERARFKIEKYFRMAYAISSERRMLGETAFERLSATRELELAGRIAGENLVSLNDAINS